jgi:hypothetical protein
VLVSNEHLRGMSCRCFGQEVANAIDELFGA